MQKCTDFLNLIVKFNTAFTKFNQYYDAATSSITIYIQINYIQSLYHADY